MEPRLQGQGQAEQSGLDRGHGPSSKTKRVLHRQQGFGASRGRFFAEGVDVKRQQSVVAHQVGKLGQTPNSDSSSS